MAATQLSIRTRARQRADQDGSTFPTDLQYNDWINAGAKATWYDLVQAGWPIAFYSTTITANGTSPIQLTGVTYPGVEAGALVDFVRGVFRLNGGQYTELDRLQEGQRAGLYSAPGGQLADYYQALIDPALGTVIELLPVPSSGTYRVDYIPEYPGFANDTDTWFGPARSDELIVLRAAAAALRKEGDVAGAAELDKEREALLQEVIKMASWYDMRNPAKVRDVNSMRRFVDPFAYQVDGLEP